MPVPSIEFAAQPSTADARSAAGPAQPLTVDERAAWFGVVAIMLRLPTELDAQLQHDAGLTFFEYLVMSRLLEQPERTMRMGALAEGSSASLSRLSHVASRLERRGYVRRIRQPGRGRRTDLILTDHGYDAVTAATPDHTAMIRELLIDAMSAEDLAALRRIGAAVTCPSGDAAPCDDRD